MTLPAMKVETKLFLILLVGFLVRLVSINQSLWMDEAISAFAVKNFSYLSLVTDFIKSDTHPPFYYLLLKFWTSIFGFSELSLRFPSVIFGVLTVYCIYKIANQIDFNFKFKQPYFPLYAALLSSVSPLLVYYSQEARMYSLTTFLTSLLIYFYLKKNWLFFGVTLQFLAVSDYLPLLILVPLWIYTLFSKDYKIHLSGFIASHIGLLAFWLFWYPVFKSQSTESLKFLEGLPAFKSILGLSNLKNLALIWVKFLIGRINFTPSVLYAFVVIFASLPAFLGLVNSFKNTKRTAFLWLLLTIPIFLSFLISLKVPGFSYFRLIFTLPIFILLISYGLSQLKKGSQIFSLLLVLQIIFTGIYLINENYWREDWKNAVTFIENRIKVNEVVFVSYPETFTPYGWYSVKNDTVKSFNKENVDMYQNLYTLDYLMDLTDPGKTNYVKLENIGFKNTEVYNFRGVGQVRYWQR